ncbi:MAG: NAD(P)H-quinone oxidoreductase [Candidatus Pelagadaptatus aseana]|uniref:NAD(P)H-quinone oxidoreductase n=1 Tax=Candidatus Pelagadaptatus aseana TaxID=3120508 RepID=UPI0039B136CA
MKYIEVKQPGDATGMHLVEGAAPVVGAGEVLISVAYAGVNRPDVLQRLGLYPPPVDASPVLGLEVSGEIAAVGEGVARWQVGDRVCALVNGGGYAEQVVVPAGQCLPVPEGLSMAEAAALPETCFTVWSNVFDRAGLELGESLMVHAGAGGIGTTAIQMGVALGAKVFATVGSQDKAELCRSLGAELVINYCEQDFVDVVMAHTAGRGVDVTLDIVGGDYIQRNIDMAAIEGRVVNIAFLQGAKAEINCMPVMLKRLVLTGSTLRPQSTQAKALIASRLQETVWPLIESGRIKPVMAAEFDLADVAEAHQLMESNQLLGKVVLKVSQ